MKLTKAERDLFKKVGRQGGKKRNKNLSSERKVEIATKASLVAKAKRDAKKEVKA